MVLGMLFYTSCELESKTVDGSFNETKLKVGSGINFSVVDEAPVFPGCENVEDKRACFNEKIQKHISKNFSYPEEAQKAGIEGRVNVMFLIDENGIVADLRMRGPDVLLEDEVERIINRLPQMQPAKQNGKVISIPYSIPIVFKLDDSEITNVQSKNYDIEGEFAFAIVEEVPIFPGCENVFDKRACFNEMIQAHISKNFNYPLAAQEAGVQGRVNVMFMITSIGVIDNIEMRGPDKLLEDEVERIIKRLPQMTPGKNEGKAVNVPFSIPVNFKLQ